MIPAEVAVTMRLNEDPENREEDYAATMMAVQNLHLSALEMGRGTRVHTSAVMGDSRTCAAVGVGDFERIVALVQVGQPA